MGDPDPGADDPALDDTPSDGAAPNGTASDGAAPDDTATGGRDDALLELSGVTAGYGNTTVIHDVDLAVEAGSIACLIGPNGSGKSTLMKSIYGFADVFDGTIRFRGEDITHRDPQDSLASGMSYLLQSSSVFPAMSVHENMLMGGFIFDDDERAAARAEELYAEFPLLGDIRDQEAATLSGGQRRLLELARSLMVDPELLLLDEPSLGLEPTFIEDLFDRVRRLNDLGTTVLLVEQNAEKGLSVADRGFVLASGEIKFTGTGTELLDHDEIGRLYLGE